jgi:hypothetical protein
MLLNKIKHKDNFDLFLDSTFGKVDYKMEEKVPAYFLSAQSHTQLVTMGKSYRLRTNEL